MSVEKARIYREAWDAAAPWATVIPPSWNPDKAYETPENPMSNYVGVYGFTTWPTFDQAIAAVREALAERKGGDELMRECKWRYAGDDDGGNLHWWLCTVHNRESVGGAPPNDDPHFGCEGWLDELHAAEAERIES